MYYYRQAPIPQNSRMFPFLFGAPLVGGFIGGLIGGGLGSAIFRPRPYPLPYPQPYPQPYPYPQYGGYGANASPYVPYR
ncbi:hypothetical protein [Heyndrickxia sporothermodurans]|uniref:hypothetical protein n=1 Tax=Heyndrickxia sporothermodurans TaxID=46224 RepID=UPI002E2416EA|nr:hypothetical protein [Heyndrickxia sporothermodurans]MED3699038.1 hypothetical protein [Heyndrickxia sporothermodurans]